MTSQRQRSRSRNTDPAMMNTPELNSPYTSQFNNWFEPSSVNVHERLVQYGVAGLPYSPSHPPQPRSSNPRSAPSTGSSMTPTLLHHHINASTGPPSLYSSKTHTTTTSDNSSINTGLIDHGQLASYPVLEEVDGVLVAPHLVAQTPLFRCVFWFLDCGYLSRARDEWSTHCAAHFHGEDPPRSVRCPLCDWAASRDEGAAAWQLKMNHLADEHFAFGQGLSTSRPDFGLFQHLWQKRLIDDEDLKELKGGNHNLVRPPGNFVRTNGRGARRERGGNVGRQRLQHVTQG